MEDLSVDDNAFAVFRTEILQSRQLIFGSSGGTSRVRGEGAFDLFGLTPQERLAQGQESCWREDTRTSAQEAARAAAGWQKPFHSSHSIPNR